MTSQGRDAANGSAAGEQYADVRTRFDDLAAGDHAALFYDSRESQLGVAAAFVANALRRNRRCLYLTDANTPDDVRAWFRDAGIDVDARVEAGDLSIRPAVEVYLGGEFDPDRIVETLHTAAQETVDEGYDGVSVAGENSWCFRTEAEFEGIVEFEAQFDACCTDLPVTTLCQYDLNDFDEAAIAKALRTHEHVVYRETLCRNPYYVPPAEYASYSDDTLNASLMLEQTYSLSRSQREIDRHEQRLSVVNRILRHDIRNDLNLVLGTLDRIRETADLDETEREQLDAAKQVANRLVDRAEKARYVQQTLADSGVDRLDLRSAIDAAADAVREAHPDATVDVESGPNPTVLADPHLETALTELLTNAVVHQSGDDPSVTVHTSQAGDTVTVEVTNPGRPVPESDRRALLQDIETPLEHSEGLGLWLVKWIVDNSRGRVRFPASDGETCRIAIDLQAVQD